MTGIGTTGKAGYDIIARGEAIHNLTFTFIAENDTQQGIYLSFLQFFCIFVFEFSFLFLMLFLTIQLRHKP